MNQLQAYLQPFSSSNLAFVVGFFFVSVFEPTALPRISRVNFKCIPFLVTLVFFSHWHFLLQVLHFDSITGAGSTTDSQEKM